MGKRPRGGGRGGGGRGGNKRQRGGGGGGGGGGTGWDAKKEWPDVVKTNEFMEAYYKQQKIVPEGEWEEFLTACRAVLPTTFRVSPCSTFASEVKDQLKTRFAELQMEDIESVDEDERTHPPKPLPWYPDELAWYMSISKKALKRTPALEKFHKYLVAETETGNLTRQEAVSMIPPLFMDVEPHHRVLDMCAAPGSKTSQLLEFIHMKTGANGVPPGVVIANDADLDRCSMLIHQAQKIPMLWGKGEGPAKVAMRYDRILCDVPCSGDGTMRKNVDVWRKWSPAQGAGLHKTQIQILTRAVELTVPGGVIVYSTCSMNPTENESVVAFVLKKFNMCLELEDVSAQLPELKRTPGLLNWRVRDKRNSDMWWDKYEEVPENIRMVYCESMFAPAEAAELKLERCVRVLPHHQDTGAFFICKLRKTADHTASKSKQAVRDEEGGKAEPAPEVKQDKEEEGKAEEPKPEEAKAEEPKPEEPKPEEEKAEVKAEAKAEEKAEAEGRGAPRGAEVTCEGMRGAGAGGDGEGDAAMKEEEAPKPEEKKEESKQQQQQRDKKSKYEVLIPIPQDKGSLVDRAVEFYGLSEGFPKEQLFTSSATSNKVYFVSAAVKELLEADGKGQLHTVHAGVKVLEKNPTKDASIFEYRLRQEGVPFLKPFMTKRILPLKMGDFTTLIKKRAMLMADLETEGAEAAARAMGGCILFTLQWDGKEEVFLAGWRGTQQLTLFVSKFELQALGHKLIGHGKEAAEEGGKAGDKAGDKEAAAAGDKMEEAAGDKMEEAAGAGGEAEGVKEEAS